ncbi:MAG TPA: Yip1 family protein [Gemmatimonadaceae bacterium]|nr:Yip1 family protein [Gemmatimonadaceae bacterium]
MTSPEIATSPAAGEASVMEDIIEIFYAPSRVFARRRDNPRFWAALFILIILVALGVWVMMRNLSTVMDAEFARQSEAAMRKNPQITPEMMERGRKMGETLGPIFAIVGSIVAIFVLGVGVWLVGKLFDSTADLTRGVMIATFASFPKVIDLLLAAILAMTVGTGSITRMMAAGPSPARFAPADTAPMVLGVLSRLSIGTIWATILIAIGLHVVGRIPKGRAYAAALILWLVGTAFALFGAIRQG